MLAIQMSGLPYRLDSEDSTRLRAVMTKVRAVAEQVGSGGRLPSVRTMMRTCGVSQSTVVNALDRLEMEGLVERRPRSGVFVADLVQQRPRLLLCEPNIVTTPTPFSEMLLQEMIRPYTENPEGAVIQFTNPQIRRPADVPVRDWLPNDLWSKLEARRFSSVVTVAADERLHKEIEALGNPVLSFGTSSRYMVRFALLEACQLGVAGLVKEGCRRIALFNTPFVSIREVFVASLAAHGVDETILPFEVFHANSNDMLVRSFHLVERGRRSAHQAMAISPRPDGVLSLDDMFTQGFILGLLEMGLKPGTDIEIASHVNQGSPALRTWEKQITQLEFSLPEVARALYEAADAIVAGRDLDPNWGRATYDGMHGAGWVYMLRPRCIAKGQKRERVLSVSAQ